MEDDKGDEAGKEGYKCKAAPPPHQGGPWAALNLAVHSYSHCRPSFLISLRPSSPVFVPSCCVSILLTLLPLPLHSLFLLFLIHAYVVYSFIFVFSQVVFFLSSSIFLFLNLFLTSMLLSPCFVSILLPLSLFLLSSVHS